ncbi:MAG: tripartite tricarboxylate transporter substrate binding protein [Alphaproteobacteria bacterium]|nr:tripartite tricarboxylate transporter substrate binding protein [Alphaproteobacteria bacterium]
MNAIRAVIVALSLIAAGHAVAQTYPDRAIRLLVGFTPGSATDVSARIFAQKLSDIWGVPVTIENVPGGGGSIAGERVARAAPDGYTLYWGANGAMTINPTLQPMARFDPARDLAPIARLLLAPSILAVNNDVPAKTVAELIALAKAHPGELSCASPGTGTPQHIACEVFKKQAGIAIMHVPYRGANFTDVIGGRIAMTFQNAGAILPTVRDGKLRPLAMTAPTRSPNMPDYPTMIEAGVADFDVTSWFGLLAPVGTPPAIIAKLHDQAVAIVAQKDSRDKLALIGLDVVTDPPEVFAQIIRTDIARWAKVIHDAGIKPGD